MKTLAIYSNKGGVGKTAAAVNLSFLAAQAGMKTLICDLDPQSSTTYYFRVKPKLKSRAKGFIKGGKRIAKSIKGTDYENLDLLPADLTHRNLASTFDKLKRPKQRLRRILDAVQNEYDLITLDCPPTISLLAENIFNAADYLLVPLIPTTLSVRSYEQLLSFFKKNKYDTDKVYAFFSMVDKRKKMHNEFMATVLQEFNGILQGSIPYLSHVEQMGIQREPVPVFAPKSMATKSYQDLWQEVNLTILT
ncbi:MAG: AAA family ATPase [Candidatus Poribacteria bacterium]|nr:AAA family ATPase [Candidatus Poribacteria bacterium]